MGGCLRGRADGLPFDHSDHPELSFLSEHIVHALENTIKHQEVLSQKTLGENLLQMMVTAVITTDAEGNVTWCNAPAERLFPDGGAGNGAGEQGVGRPTTRADSLWRISAAGSAVSCATRWRANPTQEPFLLESRGLGGRTLAVRTRQLTGGGKCLGAVALVDDITEKIFADAQQEQLERTQFWRELAAGHQPRDSQPVGGHQDLHPTAAPAVHGRGFPASSSGRWSAREVSRLEGIVAQIEGFAHPSAGVIDRADLAAMLEEAADGRSRG